jgi:hypothetical protein
VGVHTQEELNPKTANGVLQLPMEEALHVAARTAAHNKTTDRKRMLVVVKMVLV